MPEGKPTPEADKSSRPPEPVSRRSFLKRAFGAAAVTLGLGTVPKDASAQLFPVEPPVIPKGGDKSLPKTAAEKDLLEVHKDDPRIPGEFKDPIKRVLGFAKNYLNKEEEIEWEFDLVETSGVVARYSPPTSESGLTGPKLYVRYSDKDGVPAMVQKLQAGKGIAEIIRKNKGDYLTYTFSKALSNYLGTDVKKVDEGKISEDETKKVNRLGKLTDFASFSGQPEASDDLGGNKSIAEIYFDKIISLCFFEPQKFAEKIKKTNDPSLANLIGNTVQMTVEAAVIGTKWDLLGLDKKSIFSIADSSKNPKLRKFFEERVKS